MSSKTSKLKDGLKQLAQQVGIPVESVLKDFDTFINIIKSPQQTSDLCEEMITYLGTIERSLRDTDEEFKEELDELNNYLKEMKTTIEEHKSHSTRVSALMREAATQELIDRLSQRLSNSLVIFNTRVTLRRRHSTNAELVQTIQDLRSDIEKLTARLDTSATEVDNSDDVILMRDIRLESTRLIYEKNGLVRAHRAIWKTYKVELREFVGGDTESKKAAWKREVDFYKRLRHAQTLRMWGMSRPNEPNPYIVYSSGGVDYREYFRVRRPLAEVFNFLRSVNDAFMDFYQMGCYNWESIMILADQGPVIKLQHENSRNRGEASGSIVTLLAESQEGAIPANLLGEEKKDLSKILASLLKSNMLINTDEIGSEVETNMLNKIREIYRRKNNRFGPFGSTFGSRGSGPTGLLEEAEEEANRVVSTVPSFGVNLCTFTIMFDGAVYFEGLSALCKMPFPAPSNFTALNSSVLLHNLFIPDDRLWKRALSLIMDVHADHDVVEQALIHWESCPTERSLLHIMASYIIPPAQSRHLETLPDVACQPGDIGLIDASRWMWRTLGRPFSASSNKSQNAQIKATVNYVPIHVSPDFRQDWHSVSIPINQYSEVCEIKVVWNNQRSTDEEWAMWRHLKRSSVDVSTCYNAGLTDLEIVTNVILRVRIPPEEDEGLSGGDMYFHRRTSLCASGKDYWGFFSQEKDPIVATQMEAEPAQYKLKIETLSMADDLEQEANRMIEAELSQIPGSYPSS